MSARTIEAIGTHKLQQVFLSVEDHIAVMTLHNPPVNAASGTVQEEILLLCDYINHEDDIWVCVMHSDLKTFCVGVDIKRFHQSILDQRPGGLLRRCAGPVRPAGSPDLCGSRPLPGRRAVLSRRGGYLHRREGYGFRRSRGQAQRSGRLRPPGTDDSASDSTGYVLLRHLHHRRGPPR